MQVSANGLSFTQLAELAPALGSPSASIGSPSSVQSTNAPSFEQLLSRQIASQPSTSPSREAGLAETHSSGTLAGYQDARLATVESYSLFAMSGLVTPQSSVQTLSTASQPTLANTHANPTSTTVAQENETTGLTGRLNNWPVAGDEITSSELAASALSPAALESELSGIANRLALQDLEINSFNAMATANLKSATVQAAPANDEQLFLVNEFSVETTTVKAVASAANAGMTNAIQADQGAASLGGEVKIGVTQPVLRSSDPAAPSAASLIPVPTAGSLARTVDAVPLADEVAAAVTNHLEEEATSTMTTVRIQLDRADLGSISLFLSINNNKVSVRIVTEDELSRQIVQSEMDELLQSLAENDVDCDEFLVLCDSADQQPPRRKRPSQPLIALGLSSSPTGLSEAEAQLVQGSLAAKFNFVA